MAARQVDDVDIVAHAGAVGRVVIVAKHAELFQVAGGDLGDIGHQVVGNVVRVFADQSGIMGARRVEIAQRAKGPARIRGSDLLERLLADELGETVGVGVAARGGFRDRQHFRFAIDGGGRGKHQSPDAGGSHRIKQGDQAGHVGLDIVERLLGAFTHGLQRGEVDDGGNLVVGKDPVEHRAIEHVAGVACHRRAGDDFKPVQHIGLGV